MNDKQLIEFAAKAAGIYDKGKWFYHDGDSFFQIDGLEWNPLKSNEDAFWLAVTLGIDLSFHKGYMCVHANETPIYYSEKCDALEAACLAITTDAAEYWKQTNDNLEDI